jgi:hypothetical protein
MKPTIKLPFAEFIANAISNFSKGCPDLHLVPGSVQYQKKNSDGDYPVCELPDYLEIEIAPTLLEPGIGITKTEDTDNCFICGQNINEVSFGRINGKLACNVCCSKMK